MNSWIALGLIILGALLLSAGVATIVFRHRWASNAAGTGLFPRGSTAAFAVLMGVVQLITGVVFLFSAYVVVQR